jgi:hypothetical protein
LERRVLKATPVLQVLMDYMETPELEEKRETPALLVLLVEKATPEPLEQKETLALSVLQEPMD